MSTRKHPTAARSGAAFFLAAMLLSGPIVARAEPPADPVSASVAALAPTLKVGDVVFIRVAARPFREVAAATGSWTNHVGIVIDVSAEEPLIAESTFPLSRKTKLSKFAARSEGGRLAIARLKAPLAPEQEQQLVAAAERRTGIFYDTGFDLHSRRQFCSRYVREVIAEATGVQVGEVETFARCCHASRRPTWVSGASGISVRSPGQRETVTPASLLHSPELLPVFDGSVV